MMRIITVALAVIAVVFTASRCLTRGKNEVYAQIACADVSGDGRLNDADALTPAQLPDFNGDGRHDATDAAFLRGIDVSLDPAGKQVACAHKNKDVGPEWAVFDPGTLALSCDGGKKAVLILGIGGGVTNLKQNDAAGVKQTIEELTSAFQKKSVQTVTVLSGQAVNAATSGNSAMETWDAHATQALLDAYPCLRVAVIGHSHGAITGDIVAWKLEGVYGARFIEVVNIDRVETLYAGDTSDWPARIRVFNIYETGDPLMHGEARDASNVANWDATSEKGPKNGDGGGPLMPVNHTTIDNSASVSARIIDDVLSHWQ